MKRKHKGNTNLFSRRTAAIEESDWGKREAEATALKPAGEGGRHQSSFHPPLGRAKKGGGSGSYIRDGDVMDEERKASEGNSRTWAPLSLGKRRKKRE